VHNDEVDKVIKTILDLSQTGERGDGVLIVQKIEELIKIRTGEKVGPYDL
jgi:nitrogen regulatory protein PII